MKTVVLGLLLASVSYPVLAQNAGQASTTLDEVAVTGELERRGTLALDRPSDAGSRLGVASRDLPVSVSVISAETIRERGYTTALDAVTSAVGVTGGVTLGATPRFASRGFTVNNITVLRDGIRQNTLAQSARTLDPFLFDRIEVLKGPASVLHGEGAIAGAVNYVSRQPIETRTLEGLASIGSWGSWRLGAAAGGAVNDLLSVSLAGAASGSDGYVDRSGHERQAVSASAQLSEGGPFRLTGYVDWTRDEVDAYFGTPLIYDGVIRADGTTAVARANLGAGDRLVNARIDERTRRINYNVTNGYSESEYLYVRGIGEYDAGEGLSFRATAYAAFQDQDYVNSEGFTYNPVTRLVDRDGLGFIYRDDQLLGFKVDGLYRGTLLGRPNALSFGIEGAGNDQVRGTRPANVSAAAVALPSVDPFSPVLGPGPAVRPAVNAEAEVTTTAVYAENLFSLTEALKVVVGIRVEDISLARLSVPPTTTYTKDYSPTTGRIGAVWTARPGLSLYASYTEAVEPVVQLVSQTASSADFGLQSGQQVEVGAKWSFWGGRADATLALYEIEKSDILTSTVVNGVRVSQQIGAQSSRGVEAALVVTPAEGWFVEANAAYTDAQFDAFNENLGTGVVSRAGNRPDNVPEVSANLYVSKTFANGLGLQGAVRHVGERFGNNANTFVLDSYTLIDAAVSWRLGPAVATLRGRNLTDEQYTDWQVFTTTPYLHLGDPRSVELELRASF
ncbi:MAG: TonB-dependent receptor [Brevundimonas sp.]|nr:TonB-dependent receptor [Brevundimonas sp.]